MKRRRRSQEPDRYLKQLRKKLGIQTLSETKREQIRRALSIAGGDKVLAAALLGIGRTTLYRTLAH